MLEVLDQKPLRERFVAKPQVVSEPRTWTQVEVAVYDLEHNENEPIYTYHRNYSFLKTFEPFRIWVEEENRWRNFALISPEYVSFKVLDLDTKEIVATCPPPVLTAEDAESMNKHISETGRTYHEGQEFPSWGFCPVEFYVPDVLDIHPSYLNSDSVEKYVKVFNAKRSFGFVSGCIWGDDDSWKLQAVDLSAVLDGKVSTDDRFGYFILGDHLSLRQSVDTDYFFDPRAETLSMVAPVSFTLNDNAQVVKSNFWSMIDGITVES